MAMDKEELKKKLLEFMEKKTGGKGAKSKLYLKDMQRAFSDVSPREIKKAANELVQEGKLEYFSTGSTVMYGIPGRGQAVE